MGSLHFVTCCTNNGSEDVWEKNQGVGDAKKSVSLENAKKSCLGYFDISKFSSVQFSSKMVSMRSGKPICAPSRLSGASPMSPLKNSSNVADLIDDGPLARPRKEYR